MLWLVKLFSTILFSVEKEITKAVKRDSAFEDVPMLNKYSKLSSDSLSQ